MRIGKDGVGCKREDDLVVMKPVLHGTIRSLDESNPTIAATRTLTTEEKSITTILVANRKVPNKNNKDCSFSFQSSTNCCMIVLPYVMMLWITTVSILSSISTTRTTTTTTSSSAFVPDDPLLGTLDFKNTYMTNNNNKQQEEQSMMESRFQLKRPIDYEMYTVRVNTWERPIQLGIVIRHLLTCPTVAQIQVVWCTGQGAVPIWLQQLANATGYYHYDHDEESHNDNEIPSATTSATTTEWPRLVIEQHVHDNSLNARFDVQMKPPTVGILTQDDDVIRPCVAMDAGFALWTWNPERMIGYDPRGFGKVQKFHKRTTKMAENNNKKESNTNNNNNKEDEEKSHDNDNYTTTYVQEEKWVYLISSQTNEYSLVLTKFAFLHVQYMYDYANVLPIEIKQRVKEQLNCEDIAMSLYISSQTDNQVPLLADAWTLNASISIPTEKAISQQAIGQSHSTKRHACLNDFAELLHLKRTMTTTATKTKNNIFTNAELIHHHHASPNNNNSNKNESHVWLQCGVRGREPMNDDDEEDNSSSSKNKNNHVRHKPEQQHTATTTTATTTTTSSSSSTTVLPMGKPAIQLLELRQQWMITSSDQIKNKIGQMISQVVTPTFKNAIFPIQQKKRQERRRRRRREHLLKNKTSDMM